MGRGVGWRLAGCTAALSALVLPASAAASPGFRGEAGGFKSRLLLAGSNDYLIVVSSRGHKQVELTALKGLASTTYRARGRARVGAIRISRDAFAIGGDAVLIAGDPDREPDRAKVLPPEPFSGTATYRKEAGSPPGWSGDLAVRFLGKGIVPLAGEGFRATLCRNGGSFDRCQDRLTEQTFGAIDLRRWLAQGRGSQSQAFWDDRLSWSR